MDYICMSPHDISKRYNYKMWTTRWKYKQKVLFDVSLYYNRKMIRNHTVRKTQEYFIFQFTRYPQVFG